jgi:hypothetical protein
MQHELKSDYEAMSFTVLTTVSATFQGTLSDSSDSTTPKWNGPDKTVVRVLAILYSSLFASIAVAFVAILGRQWLTHYAKPEHGSSIDTLRSRKLKMDGMDTWCFNLVMDCLLVLLNASLLLLGIGLATYLLPLSQTVAVVVIGFTSFRLLFYLASSVAAIIFQHCPLQTPCSLTVRYLISSLVPKTWAQDGTRRRPRPVRRKTKDKAKTVDEVTHPMWTLAADPDTLFSQREIDWDGYVVYSNCVTWIFEKPVENDTIMAIISFIPEIVWHGGIKTTPLERIYDNLLECFDDKVHCPTVLSRYRDRAYLSAKALLHIIIQRRCLGDEADAAVVDSISARHPRMGYRHYEDDSDLESTLCITDILLGASVPALEWENLKLTAPHHSWMAHILLYRAWDTIINTGKLTEDVTGFIKHSLSLDPPPQAAVVADCLLMIGLVLGIGVHVGNLSVVDKRCAIPWDYLHLSLLLSFQPRSRPQTDRVYERLTTILRNQDAANDEIDRALLGMEFVAPLLNKKIAQKSYELFHVIMDTHVSLTFTAKKKWTAARLMVDGAYNWDRFLPWVGGPAHMLAFLEHHFELIATDENWDVPIQNALRALAYASGPVTIDTREI